MKRYSFAWAIALTLSLTACGGEANKESKETPKEKTTENPPSETEKPETPKPEPLTEEGKKMAKKWFMKTLTHTDGKTDKITSKKVLFLKEDATFELLSGEKAIASGNWSLKGKDLILKHLTGAEKDQTEKMVVKEVTDKKLVTVDDDGKMTETYETE